MINKKSIDIIIEFEGMRLSPYKCPAGKYTIGIGSTFYENGNPVSKYDKKITEEYARKLLSNEIEKLEKQIKSHVKIKLTNNQIASLISFAYNVGIGSFKSSTLLKKLNNGDILGAANEFLKWNKATVKGKKVVLAGLTKRRKAERELFLS